MRKKKKGENINDFIKHQLILKTLKFNNMNRYYNFY